MLHTPFGLQCRGGMLTVRCVRDITIRQACESMVGLPLYQSTKLERLQDANHTAKDKKNTAIRHVPCVQKGTP
jgi:hypothetical protein